MRDYDETVISEGKVTILIFKADIASILCGLVEKIQLVLFVSQAGVPAAPLRHYQQSLSHAHRMHGTKLLHSQPIQPRISLEGELIRRMEIWPDLDGRIT